MLLPQSIVDLLHPFRAWNSVPGHFVVMVWSCGMCHMLDPELLGAGLLHSFENRGYIYESSVVVLRLCG